MGAIGYKGDIYPNGSATAKDSVFDNTGTDLESTNAEDAIKEVDGKVEELSSNKREHNAKVGTRAPVIIPTSVAGTTYIPFPYYIAPGTSVIVDIYIPGVGDISNLSCTTWKENVGTDSCVFLTGNATITGHPGVLAEITIKQIN